MNGDEEWGCENLPDCCEGHIHAPQYPSSSKIGMEISRFAHEWNREPYGYCCKATAEKDVPEHGVEYYPGGDLWWRKLGIPN